MPRVTSAQPYVFGQSFRDETTMVIGVQLNGGTVTTQQLINGVWINTGDVYSDGSYRVATGSGGISLRVLCTGSAVVEVP
jgi:hypothetical protein